MKHIMDTTNKFVTMEEKTAINAWLNKCHSPRHLKPEGADSITDDNCERHSSKPTGDRSSSIPRVSLDDDVSVEERGRSTTGHCCSSSRHSRSSCRHLVYQGEAQVFDSPGEATPGEVERHGKSSLFLNKGK